MSEKTRLIAGAMSGTSADGVDVALVRIDGTGLAMSVQLIRHHARLYDAALKRAIFALRGSGQVSLSELARVGREISLTYAACVNEALSISNLKAGDLSAIAAHGQTLYHEPPSTIQWLDPALIAAETGCAVVSDFRRADCAAGGQGAPLVPFADYVLFRHPTKDRVLLNIGGIANVTYVAAGAEISRLIAFDTGPGNCISDWICRQYDPSGLGWDDKGAGALQGRVDQGIVERFLADSYFGKGPPKTTDGPAMIRIFEIAMGDSKHELNDLLATAANVTAASIARGIKGVLSIGDGEVELIASGGGVNNKAMMGWLGSLLGSGVAIRTSEDLNVPFDAKEAMAFALLGAATLDAFGSNVPSCTGARHRVVLGSVTPKPH